MSVSRYEVLARIATGGMGSVFVGRYKAQLGVSRLVAIKRPHPFILADPKLRQRVIEEARTASAIHHANVVAVVDVELIDGEPVLILDYVEGATLSELVRCTAGGTSYEIFAPIAVRILLDTARGLGAAHALGILHRDVTPQNVLVGVDGVARLSDFGIAKSTADGVEPTVSGSIKGKLGYLAPEVLAACPFVVQSDLFALAVVAWEALTLQRLFGGGPDAEVITRLLALARPPLGAVAPAVAPFEDLLSRTLAREQTDRPDSAAAFALELEATAQRSCGIASTAEVAAFVEHAVGEALRARRAQIDSSRARPVEEIDQLPLRPPSPRDEIETASVSAVSAAPGVGVEASARAAPARSRRGRWALAGAIACVGGVVVIVASRASPPKPSPLAVASDTAMSEQVKSAPPSDELPPPSETALTPPADVSRPSTPPSVTRGSGRPRPAGRGAASKPSASAFPTHAPPNPYAH